MVPQPNVPLWVALVVGAAGASIGFLLAVPADPSLTWLSPTLRIALGATNAALIFIAAFLNIRKSGA